MHIGSLPGVCGLSAMQVQPLFPLRKVLTAPLASTVIIAASCAIEAGAAVSALATGSIDAAWPWAAGASTLSAAKPALLQAPTLSNVPASSTSRIDADIMMSLLPQSKDDSL